MHMFCRASMAETLSTDLSLQSSIIGCVLLCRVYSIGIWTRNTFDGGDLFGRLLKTDQL